MLKILSFGKFFNIPISLTLLLPIHSVSRLIFEPIGVIFSTLLLLKFNTLRFIKLATALISVISFQYKSKLFKFVSPDRALISEILLLLNVKSVKFFSPDRALMSEILL